MSNPTRPVPARPDEGPTVNALVPREMAGWLSRRSLMGLAIGAGALGLTAACGGSPSKAPSGPTPDGKLEADLNLYTWGAYDDPDVLKDFTGTVGPKVKLGSYTSNEEMIAKLVAGKGTAGYDIVVPSGYIVPQMVQNGLLTKLDHSLLPNLKNVSPAFLNPDFDKDNAYTVIKDWGVTGYVYDTKRVSRRMETWTDFWEVAQNEASGSFSLLDASGDWAAAYFNANGIDQNTTDKAHLDAYEAFMVDKIAKHIQTFDSAPGSGAIPQNGRILMQVYNGDARLGILANKDRERYRWVFPAPVTNRWQDMWAIPVGAKNPDAAHAFINYVLSPEISLRESTYLGYDTATVGLKAQAEKAKMELPDIVFFSDAQIAATNAYQQTSAAQRLTEIETKIRAASSK